jgi:hypothetical protein
MENKEIYFEIILPRSAYLNYRLGITKTVAPGETAIETWNRACEEAEQWHKEKHPELYKHNENPLTVEETEVVQAIGMADTVDKLARLKTQLTKNTQKYYVEKLKTLTDNHSTK